MISHLFGNQTRDWRVLWIPVEGKVAVWAKRNGIRVEQSVGDQGLLLGWRQTLKGPDYRQTLTTAHFGVANIRAQPFPWISPTVVFPKQIQHGWVMDEEVREMDRMSRCRDLWWWSMRREGEEGNDRLTEWTGIRADKWFKWWGLEQWTGFKKKEQRLKASPSFSCFLITFSVFYSFCYCYLYPIILSEIRVW